MSAVRWKTGWILITIGILLLTTATLIGLVPKPNLSSEKSLNTSNTSNTLNSSDTLNTLNSSNLSDTANVDNSIDENNSDNNKDLISPKPAQQMMTIQDFPSPVKAAVKRQAGNTYSEGLDCYLFHAGTDYALREGTIIRVLHEGTVTYAGEDPLLGQKVEIDGGDGWSIIYGGLDNLRVKQGDFVSELDAIGQVGFNPGAESQDGEPQLHFEVWYDDFVQVPTI